jgi:predicted Zn-dependent peptidase
MTDTFYNKTVLPNGITVITESIESVRSVALGLWFAVGSRSESGAESGMSHFLEHMMFKGTSTRSASDISESFDRLGAELNAFTSKEYTCYFARFLDEHLGEAMGILSDMVCDPELADDAITSEKEVVLEEISRHDDAPDDAVHDLFAATLWPDHPLGAPILGTRATVSAFDRNASAGYRSRHYRTGDLVVVAAGSVAHDEVVALAQEHLAGLPESDPADRDHVAPGDPGRLAVVTKDTEQAHIVLGVRGLRAGDDDRYALSVLDAAMGGGMSSRLFLEIRERRGLAYAVYSYHSLFRETGSLAFYVGTRPTNAEQVVELVREQVADIVANGLPDAELLKVKQSITGHLVLGLENTRARMTRLGKNEITESEILSIDEIVSRLEAVTSADVRELASRLLEGPTTLAMIGPMEESDVAHLAT